ncbi:MAG: helix-turn-helix domain-containing protein [Vagococcus sp.]|uniref:helix-turn-helix domain-containing protein n=1 Tax=Vagococcus sp. TaxID=1933889 RepID=UPI002FC83350
MEKDLLNLLDTQNKIMINMLDLISESHRWYTVNEISHELNVVERTVQRYVHRLKELIDDYNEERNHHVSISYEKYKGVLLEIDRGSNYMELKSYILENDETMKIFKLIIFEEFQSISKYAAAEFVSENLVRKSLKKIKEFLNMYQLTLSRSTFIIEGEEKQIRLIVYISGWIIFKGVTWPFDFISQDKVYLSVDSFSEELEIGFSVIHRKQMAYMLAVNILRLRKKHVIEMEEDWKTYANLPKLIDRLPVLNTFIEDYNIYIESELYFYLILIQLKPKLYESTTYCDSVLNYHKKMNSNVYQATEQFMDLFSQKMIAIPNELKERFFVTSFCAHLFCHLFSNIQVDIDGYMIFKDLENDYPNLKIELSNMIKELHQSNPDPLFLRENFLLQKYMLLFSSVLPLTYFEPIIQVFLDTDLPYFVKNNVTEQIANRFKYEFNIAFINENVLDTADLILTNIPNVLEEELRFSNKVHLFEFPFSQRDFAEIERKMKGISQNRLIDI